IFVPARDFDDRLSSLLDRSVAHLHPGTASNLLEAAKSTGVRTSLVLDGVNECPRRLLAKLIKDLHAFILRWPMPVVLTGWEITKLQKDMTGQAYHFAPLNQEERAAVIGAYGPGGTIEDALRLCEGFRTPYELSLAARLLNEISATAHRTGLLDAYVGKQCEM